MYIMPSVMAFICSILFVYLRRLQISLADETKHHQKSKEQVLHLNQRLQALLEYKTSLLNDTQDQLALAQTRSDLGNLAFGLLHDLNNALSVIDGSFQLLEGTDNLNESIEIKQDLQHGLEKARLLTQEFKTLLHPQKTSKDHSVNLVHLCQHLFPFLERSLPKHHQLTWMWTPDPPKNPYVALNEVQMTQILMNLIINARDALEDHPSGKIQINLNERSMGIELHVIDNGCGIPSEIQDQIFNPFFTTKEPGKGTGLGLHVLAEAIKKVGGQINVMSSEGEGTHFILDLPFTSHQENQSKMKEDESFKADLLSTLW
jgi:signal transduction histidine kinase